MVRSEIVRVSFLVAEGRVMTRGGLRKLGPLSHPLETTPSSRQASEREKDAFKEYW